MKNFLNNYKAIVLVLILLVCCCVLLCTGVVIKLAADVNNRIVSGNLPPAVQTPLTQPAVVKPPTQTNEPMQLQKSFKVKGWYDEVTYNYAVKFNAPKGTEISVTNSDYGTKETGLEIVGNGFRMQLYPVFEGDPYFFINSLAIRQLSGKTLYRVQSYQEKPVEKDKRTYSYVTETYSRTDCKDTFEMYMGDNVPAEIKGCSGNTAKVANNSGSLFIVQCVLDAGDSNINVADTCDLVVKSLEIKVTESSN